MGHMVSVFYADWEATEPVEGSIDGAHTLALPVPYHLLRQHNAVAALVRRPWLSRVGLAYRDAEASERAQNRLTLRRLRAPLEGNWSVTWRLAVHRVRHGFWRLNRRRVDRATDRRRLAGDWRTELPNVADLEAAFAGPLMVAAPDVLLVHDVALLWGAVNAKKAWAERGQLVALVYDARVYLADDARRRQYQRMALHKLEQAALEHVDAVITSSEAMAEQLAKNWGWTAPPAVVMNLPRQAALDQLGQREGLRRDIGLPSDVPLLVYSGKVRPERNLTALVDAIKPMPDVHLALVCLPSTEYQLAQRLRTYCESVRLAERVHLVNPVPPDQLVGFLAEADMGLFAPTLGEAENELSLPGVVLDYLAAGLPVAVSELANLSRFVAKHGVGQCFCPKTTQSVTDGIEAGLSNSEVLRAAVIELRAQAWFSWEAQSAKLGEVLAGVTAHTAVERVTTQ